MVEVERARSGVPYLVVNQRRLGSSIDPQAEGHKWVNFYESRLQNKSHIYVLGLGSGYHLFDLAARYPQAQITGFDIHQQVIDALMELHPSQQNLRFQLLTLPFDQLIEAKALQSAVVLKHAPSFNLNPHSYQEAQLFLNGRHPDYIAFYQTLVSSYGSLEVSSDAISIFDFEKALQAKANLTLDDRLWLMLRELVK